MQATTLPSFGGYFGDYGNYREYLVDVIIKVPMASVDAYKNAPGWSNYSSQISRY